MPWKATDPASQIIRYGAWLGVMVKVNKYLLECVDSLIRIGQLFPTDRCPAKITLLEIAKRFMLEHCYISFLVLLQCPCILFTAFSDCIRFFWSKMSEIVQHLCSAQHGWLVARCCSYGVTHHWLEKIIASGELGVIKSF